MLSCFSLKTVRARALLRSLAFLPAMLTDPPLPPPVPMRPPGPFLPPPLDVEDNSPSMTLMSSSEKSQGAEKKLALENDRKWELSDSRKNQILCHFFHKRQFDEIFKWPVFGGNHKSSDSVFSRWFGEIFKNQLFWWKFLKFRFWLFEVIWRNF